MTTTLTFFTTNPRAGKRREASPDARSVARHGRKRRKAPGMRAGERREASVRWALAAATVIAATVALLAPPLIVTTVTVPEARVLARDSDRDAGASRPIGTFTGEYADGVPVYRLPPVTVIGERTTSVAAVARRNAMPN